jgi:hypothetical protein
MFKIVPFKEDSTGAAILTTVLKGKKISSSERVNPETDIVVNWGTGYTSRRVDVNTPEAICNAVYKDRAFSLFKKRNVNHPEITMQRSEAKKWLEDGFMVYSRGTLCGERGRGIEVLQPNEQGLIRLEEVSAEAFTKRFNTLREFRVHVAFGECIEVNEKKRRNHTNPDPLIRSSSDWVFCVYNLAPYPDSIKSHAVKAVRALGLDFGGVDLAIDSEDNVCVFEVNTAPWINRESTMFAYRDAFFKEFPNQDHRDEEPQVDE